MAANKQTNKQTNKLSINEVDRSDQIFTSDANVEVLMYSDSKNYFNVWHVWFVAQIAN